MKDIFIHYDTHEQYAEAFQNMIDAREKWREEIRRSVYGNNMIGNSHF